MFLLGATAVEDTLQDDVLDTNDAYLVDGGNQVCF